jgi:hypothetical protein
MSSLQKILDIKPNLIYPGHGPVVKDAVNRIKDYINHRNMRNEQILNSLKNSNEPMDVESIVRSIYIVILIFNMVFEIRFKQLIDFYFKCKYKGFK